MRSIQKNTACLPDALLNKADKILFITHLAIGDFTYLHHFFMHFSKKYPHIKMHIWIDELRRTHNPRHWPHLQKYALYDWLEACPFFDHVYKNTYNPQGLTASIERAQQENYPIIVSLATLRPYLYATLARQIGPHAFIVGMTNKPRWFAPWDSRTYKQLNATFSPFIPQTIRYHITDVYADWFYQLCHLTLNRTAYFPSITIPLVWQENIEAQLKTWQSNHSTIVFINPYAKTPKRTWPLKRVLELMATMQSLPAWKNATFIINTPPEAVTRTQRLLHPAKLPHVHLFSAMDNFFQLPAMLARATLIISVETATMHLANAVHVPVIALMRQKNPEWAPLDETQSTIVTTRRRNEWVRSITVSQIIAKLSI